MITVVGNVEEKDIALIDDLKTFFEADNVVLDWNGKVDADTDPCKTTLAITNIQPPYRVPCKIITLAAAQLIMAT